MNFSETIIFDNLLQKLNINLDSFDDKRCERFANIAVKNGKDRETLENYTMDKWTRKFYLPLIINFKSEGQLFMDFVLDRQVLSRQRVKMVRKPSHSTSRDYKIVLLKNIHILRLIED